MHVTLSNEANGTVTTYLNGRQRARLVARTMTRSGRLEYDYGIYQSGVSKWETATGKNKANIPPQVVYYSGVVLGRVQ
ncbi:MAG: hypothetical protein MK180_17130 [Rhodobacteraceae bacterium]|nr:hypothetical protein [Paracoccaceae bacterium]